MTRDLVALWAVLIWSVGFLTGVALALYL